MSTAVWNSLPAWPSARRDDRAFFGAAVTAAIIREVEQLLDEEHAKRGRSIIVDLWQAITIDRRPGEPAPDWVMRAIEGRMNDEELSQAIQFMGIYGGRQRKSFDGLAVSSSPPITWPSASAAGLSTYSTYGFNLIVRAYLHNVFRIAENRARTNAGVPRIGEGWVSEVMLYHQLRDAFPEARVIHQARPKWLGQQSLDIAIPEWNVGVEYQGAQHHRPVDRFGGQGAFITQQDRDERKRRLCAANGYSLIEVLPNYAIDEVIAQINGVRPSPQRRMADER